MNGQSATRMRVEIALARQMAWLHALDGLQARHLAMRVPGKEVTNFGCLFLTGRCDHASVVAVPE